MDAFINAIYIPKIYLKWNINLDFCTVVDGFLNNYIIFNLEQCNLEGIDILESGMIFLKRETIKEIFRTLNVKKIFSNSKKK